MRESPRGVLFIAWPGAIDGAMNAPPGEPGRSGPTSLRTRPRLAKEGTADLRRDAGEMTAFERPESKIC